MGKAAWERTIIVLLALCAIICLLEDVTNAVSRNKREKNKPMTRKRSKKRRYKQNSVTLPSDEVDRPSIASHQINLPKKSKKPVKSDKPHIIFVVADDLGYNDVGYHIMGTGCVAKTPTINALALSGVRLENYYVQPTCTPTRASIMTGRYPIRMGLQHGNIRSTDPKCLPINETTLPEKLQELGYTTHAVGKWHLGFSSPACMPTRRGFDSFLGIVMGTSDQYTHNHFEGAKSLYSNEAAEYDYEGIHSSDLYTQHVVKIIRRHDRSVPLFLYLSFQAVHSPVEVPDIYKANYKKRYPGLWEEIGTSGGNSKRLDYLGLLETIDVGLDLVVRALKQFRLWENSVLVFTSDNGGPNINAASNWPLRGEKNTLWEGGIKAVGFVNSPLLSQNVIGTVETGLIHVSDWFPTLIEGVAKGVAEGPLPLDGINMWPTIAYGHPSPRYEILHNIDHFKNNRINLQARNPPPKSHTWDAPDRMPFSPFIYASIRYDNWKLITGLQKSKCSSWVPSPESFMQTIPMSDFDHPGVYLRLYDLTEDPGEKNNLATSNPHIVYQLLNRLKYHNKNVMIPKYSSSDDPRSYPVRNGTGYLAAWKPWLP